ncbi:MAG TPA: zinc metallopeptidase [Candidatus Merdivicinus intestinavium]|nr:zinc metallopeptidase [Candidatus Merdivicinus intestinavium]
MLWGFVDVTYLIFIVPAAIIAIWAQVRVKSTYSRYGQMLNREGLTGAQAARLILDRNGLQHIRIERVSGSLTDHYSPKENVIRLSDSTYNAPTIGAVGVAAHEAGHAVQYDVGYFPIRLRNGIIPICQIGSQLSWPLFLLGMIFQSGLLLDIGILLFCIATLFQLITLPVEFNASRRAMETLEGEGILAADELSGARKVLSAAAMTYVAALVTALAHLLRMLVLRNRNDRR